MEETTEFIGSPATDKVLFFSPLISFELESIGQTGRRLSFRDANVKTKPSIVISYLFY